MSLTFTGFEQIVGRFLPETILLPSQAVEPLSPIVKLTIHLNNGGDEFMVELGVLKPRPT
ncbi:MAG: hypothetical protein P4L79_10410 [Legionella sp.]|uniref:hypothetical protein n=1 Tax=Legionella sp. TaxID=459 RepID=UPI00285142A3|nr:hypothetical protein [Legionella sp.]